jgi:hypothetical protein
VSGAETVERRLRALTKSPQLGAVASDLDSSSAEVLGYLTRLAVWLADVGDEALDVLYARDVVDAVSGQAGDFPHMDRERPSLARALLKCGVLVENDPGIGLRWAE